MQKRNPSTDQDVRQLAENILNQYGNNILRLAYSYVANMDDAQDVLQETLLQVMRSQPVFENEEHEKGWLFRVAINKAQDKLRHRSRQNADQLSDNLAAESRQDLSFVWQAVAELPEKYRIVIHLFYQEEMTSDEISKITGQCSATVRSLLFRGRQMLKDKLKEAYDFDE